jgi:His-Xaa-Ser system radical SAM maturase HxsC
VLPLHGTASQIEGFSLEACAHVLRLRSSIEIPNDLADTAIIRELPDAEIAANRGFKSAVLIEGSARCDVAALPTFSRMAILPNRFAYLSDGDIIAFRNGGPRFRTLYRRNSLHNSFLVTERCNHYCLMCSQPPRDIDDGWILDEIKVAIPLINPRTRSLGFTGGEPLLDWKNFITVLQNCRDQLPETAIHVLSNGRAFADGEVVSAWADVHHPNLMVGIPIYSAVDYIHDYVVQALDAFDETVLGILKLKDKGQRVEVRVVLHAITAPRIVETCRWIVRNLPIVDHVALMGVENTGFAIANDELLWIDPVDYREQLTEAVHTLAAAKVNISVYNLPRCVLAPSIWPYAMQSISDWKNAYVAECERCVEKPRCSGFFTTGRTKYSRGISAIA